MMRGSVFLSHAYPAAEATACTTPKSAEAKDNHQTFFLRAPSLGDHGQKAR